MRTLYLSQQGCYVSLKQENIVVKRADQILQQAQLPLLEQILVFGQSQITTQVIRACLWRDIPIAYLSRLGYCYGRMIAIERGYRQLVRYQQQLSGLERLGIAQAIVQAKLLNCRVILLREQRRQSDLDLKKSIQMLEHLADQVQEVTEIDRLLGVEGTGAAQYFQAFGLCLNHSDFSFVGRTRRPPGNPVNAMLSFGYQVLWNHLLSLIELQDLDPYLGCLHQSGARHASLVSDLIEEFRAPLIDLLVLRLVNHHKMEATADFEYRDGGCFLNESGRQKWLRAFVNYMEETIDTGDNIPQPRWDLLNRQVRRYKQFVYSPLEGYKPYRIR